MLSKWSSGAYICLDSCFSQQCVIVCVWQQQEDKLMRHHKSALDEGERPTQII